MKFDNLYTRAIVSELAYLKEGARIEKVHQPTKFEVVLNLRTKQGNKKLLLSIHPETFRMHITKRTIENPPTPKQFCIVLRKHVESGRISNIEQLNHDRYVKLTIDTYNSVGDEVQRFLYLEMMGRHSNLILTDESMVILDALKHIDASQNDYREILPKLPYIAPPKQINKDNGSTYFIQPFYKRWMELNKVSPEVLAMHALDPHGFYYYNSSTKEEFVTFLDISNSLDIQLFDVLSSPTLSESLDIYFHDKLQKQQLGEKLNHLVQFVQKEIQKDTKKLKHLRHDLQQAEGYERYQEYGNLIVSQQQHLPDNVEEVTVTNYFSPSQEQLRIPTNKKLTAAENAQKYFKKYNKSKNALVKVQEQIEKTEKDIAYFQSIASSLEMANLQDATEIQDELTEQGYLKKKVRNQKKKQKVELMSFTYENTKILVGKNNLQNDMITMKERRRDFGWLHVKDFPGSHVLICTKNPDEQLQYIGALLAAYYSKMRNSENVAVDYTLVQNVTKPSGSKPGFVIYKNQQTKFVTPSRANLQVFFPEEIF